MNERTTNLTPNVHTHKHSDSHEFKFNQQLNIAEGTAGLLAHATCEDELKNINDSVIACAVYSIQDAIGEMTEIFHDLLDHSLAVQRQVKEQSTPTKAINTNIDDEDDDDTSPNIKRHGPECEFNHQHIIAEGVAGTLFTASSSPTGSMNNPVINSAAYALESAIREMDKCFQAQLREDMAGIKSMREAETTRKDKIMELVDEFEDEHPHLRNDSIYAIKIGMTVEDFQEHLLRAISEKNFKLKNANQS